MKKKLTKAKAKMILHEGMARGHKLTEKQRKFMGMRASGQLMKKPKGFKKLAKKAQQ